MLVSILVVLVVVALVLYGVSFLSPPLDANITRLIQAVVVIGAAIWLLVRSGLAS